MNSNPIYWYAMIDSTGKSFITLNKVEDELGYKILYKGSSEQEAFQALQREKNNKQYWEECPYPHEDLKDLYDEDRYLILLHALSCLSSSLKVELVAELSRLDDRVAQLIKV